MRWGSLARKVARKVARKSAPAVKGLDLTQGMAMLRKVQQCDPTGPTGLTCPRVSAKPAGADATSRVNDFARSQAPQLSSSMIANYYHRALHDPPPEASRAACFGHDVLDVMKLTHCPLLRGGLLRSSVPAPGFSSAGRLPGGDCPPGGLGGAFLPGPKDVGSAQKRSAADPKETERPVRTSP